MLQQNRIHETNTQNNVEIGSKLNKAEENGTKIKYKINKGRTDKNAPRKVQNKRNKIKRIECKTAEQEK